jgi:flagellar assembly factor FliW
VAPIDVRNCHAHCATKYFGTIAYDEASVLQFPAGLPGFENERRFVSLEQPEHQPLVFLQSLTTPGLCFIALPAKAIEPSFALEAEEADLDVLGAGSAQAPALLNLALITILETGITANLFAPVVINTANLRAVQAIASSRRYSHVHPLAEIPELVCS